jgi:hypothetical protein
MDAMNVKFWHIGVITLLLFQCMSMRPLEASVRGDSDSTIGLIPVDTGIEASAIAYDTKRQLLYAGIQDAAPAHANELVALTVPTGSIAYTLPIMSGVIRVAMTDQNDYLYVAGNSEVRRVNLDTRQTDRSFQTCHAAFGCGLAYDLSPLPGQADSIIVTELRGSQFLSFVFDRGISRPSFIGWTGIDASISVKPGSMELFHLGFTLTPAWRYDDSITVLSQLALDAGGLRTERTITLTNFGADAVILGDALFGSGGGVVDLPTFSETASVPVDGVLSYDVATNPAQTRLVYAAIASGSDDGRIQIYEHATRRQLGKVTLGAISGGISAVVPLGESAIAYIEAGSPGSNYGHSRLYIAKLISAPMLPAVDAGPDRDVHYLPGVIPVTLRARVPEGAPPISGLRWVNAELVPQVDLKVRDAFEAWFDTEFSGAARFRVEPIGEFGQVGPADELVLTARPPYVTNIPLALRDARFSDCFAMRLADFSEIVPGMQPSPQTGYENGAFVHIAAEDNYALGNSPDWGVPRQARLGLDVWFDAAHPPEGAGLAFGIEQDSSKNWLGLYTFTIDPQARTYAVSRWSNDTPTVIASGSSGAIAGPSSRQRLEVRHDGASATFYVNGTVLANAPLAISPRLTTLGVFSINNGRAGAKTYFDNLSAAATAQGECVYSSISDP